MAYKEPPQISSLIYTAMPRVGRKDSFPFTLQKRNSKLNKSQIAHTVHMVSEIAQKRTQVLCAFFVALRDTPKYFPWRELYGSQGPSTRGLRGGVELGMPACLAAAVPPDGMDS